MSIISPIVIGDIVAKSASSDIDIATIQSGCHAIRAQLDVLSSIHSNFDSSAAEIDINSLAINYESPVAVNIGNCDNDVLSYQNNIESILSDTISMAEAAYNRSQTEYNNDAIREYNAEQARKANQSKD